VIARNPVAGVTDMNTVLSSDFRPDNLVAFSGGAESSLRWQISCIRNRALSLEDEIEHIDNSMNIVRSLSAEEAKLASDAMDLVSILDELSGEIEKLRLSYK